MGLINQEQVRSKFHSEALLKASILDDITTSLSKESTVRQSVSTQTENGKFNGKFKYVKYRG